jgi:hypothetical protein
VDDLAPDIAFVDLPRVRQDELQIFNDEVLGEGSFGKVVKGKWRGLAQVAVKVLSEGLSETDGLAGKLPLPPPPGDMMSLDGDEEDVELRRKFWEFQQETFLMA